MKIAILGGSFNPVHIGHLFLADSVLTSLGYDRLILVPAYQSPFKIDAEGASPNDRLQMLAASIPGDPRLTIDDCEISREGVSYTIDTVKDIIARYMPDGKPGLVLGDDLAASFHNWRNPGEIAELADIIIARRLSSERPFSDPNVHREACPDTTSRRKTSFTGDEYTCSAEAARGNAETAEGNVEASRGNVEASGFPYPYTALDNEIINVSSHLVREKIRNNEAWRYLVPSGARYIIEDRSFYGYAASAGGKRANENENGHGNVHENVHENVYENKPENGRGKVRANVRANVRLMGIIVQVENDIRATAKAGRFIHSRNTALLSWDLCRRFNLDPQKGYLAGIAHDMCKSA
ncbi:MAG: nicotinate (nicotinamide) nucleotide adenylyltransferase, partial [Treponema sp.]|nr:nicotinate (nicotinamide) nucleotide adenylyltransferase [Treponema sp.]